MVTRQEVEASLEELNSHIRSHGGRVELAGFDETTRAVSVRLIGLCTSCPAWPATLYGTIRPHLLAELGLEDVEIEDRRLSAGATRRLDLALGGRR